MQRNKLTPKQQAFVEHYCGDCNYVGTKAYLAAGYAKCTGWQHNAIKVLHNNYIKEAIQVYQAKKAEKIDVTVEFIIQTILKALDLAQRKQDLPAIARFTDQLGRYKAMFTENIHQSGAGLNVNIASPEPQKEPKEDFPKLANTG